MSTITLTEEQHKAIIADMDKQVELLSSDEIELLASRLNEKINIPFIKEGTEQTILVKTVKRFDRLLYDNLPNELYGLVQNSGDGISDEDADELEYILGSRLNKKFDIPYLPEVLEEKIFKLLVGMIVTAMRKKYSVLNQPAA